MLYPKITSAIIIENYTLFVNFSNHQTKKYNCEKLLEKQCFLTLKTTPSLKTFHSIHKKAQSLGMMKLISVNMKFGSMDCN